MPWTTIKSYDGIYAVDWQAVSRLIRSYARSEALLKYSKENSEGHWIGPTVHTIDVDWETVRNKTDENSEGLMRDFYFNSFCNTRPQIGRLVYWVEMTRRNNIAFQKKMQQAQHTTMQNISSSVQRLETAKAVSEFTRDASAEFLMVSATIVTGGVAGVGGGLVMGASLKTTAKYQDAKYNGHESGKIPSTGQLAGYFVIELGSGLIDLAGARCIGRMAEAAKAAAELRGVGHLAAKAAEKGAELGLAVLWNVVKGLTVEPAKGVIEGALLAEDKSKGVATGGMKAVGGAHGELLKFLIGAEGEKGRIIAAIADTAISRAADVLADRWTEKDEKEPENKETHTIIVTPRSQEQLLTDSIAYSRHDVQQIAIYQVGSAAPPSFPPKPKAAFRPLRFHPAR